MEQAVDHFFLFLFEQLNVEPDSVEVIAQKKKNYLNCHKCSNYPLVSRFPLLRHYSLYHIRKKVLAQIKPIRMQLVRSFALAHTLIYVNI